MLVICPHIKFHMSSSGGLLFIAVRTKVKIILRDHDVVSLHLIERLPEQKYCIFRRSRTLN
jgi:hypothetical protein